MLDWNAIDTVLLDMDGTLLDLAFDNLFWVKIVPEAYVKTHGVSIEEMQKNVLPHFEEIRHSLDWYNIDYWSSYLKLDLPTLKVEHQEHIDYLPMAEFFLERLRKDEQRAIIITNADPKAYMIKNAKTGVGNFVEEVISSHDLGYPKEDQNFWTELEERIDFDKTSSLFVDDTPQVLLSAHQYGIANIAAIAQPDTSRDGSAFTDETALQTLPDSIHIVNGVMDLISL